MLYKFPVNPELNNKLENNSEIMVCPDCNGTGSDPQYDEVNSEIFKIQNKLNRNEDEIFIMNCLKCKGDGYIDWLENARGKINRDCKRPLMKNIREASVYFLYSCLFGDESYFSQFIHYISYSDEYYISFQIDFGASLKYFNEGIKLVDNYLLPKDRRMFHMGLHRWMIMRGYACTHCFKMIPAKYFKDKHRSIAQRIAMTPEIEMNYWELYLEDKNLPNFILCDNCNFKLNFDQIKKLKQEAFNPYNTYEFSDIHTHKLLEYLYGIYYEKYFDTFSQYSKMEI